MSKELFIAAHEELIEEYMAANEDADYQEAYEKTADGAYERYCDKFAGLIDRARMESKYASK